MGYVISFRFALNEFRDIFLQFMEATKKYVLRVEWLVLEG